MAKGTKDIAASVRARLQALAKRKGQPFEALLVRYALERFLYRLSQSAFVGRFALKGAILLTAWFDEPLRPTRDLDLLGFGDSGSDPMLAVFRETCSSKVEDDGLVFDTSAIRVEKIREELAYGGLRLSTAAVLAGAPVAQQAALAQFGKHFGTAYQLVDDALDYKSDPATRGKNLGDDLAEGKPTLPLLHALRHGDDEQRALIRLAIEQGGLAQLGPIVEAIESTGGLDYAAAFAQRETSQALAALEALPDSPYSRALASLASEPMIGIKFEPNELSMPSLPSVWIELLIPPSCGLQ